MIEIIEILWHHSGQTSMPDGGGARRGQKRKSSGKKGRGGNAAGVIIAGDDDDAAVAATTSNTAAIATVDVGGTTFPLTRRISNGDVDENDANDGGMLVVASGKSHLSYLSVGVLSSVLYLDPDHAMMTSAYDDKDDDNNCDDNVERRAMLLSTEKALALEMHYHLPARAVDLRRATHRLIEANMPIEYRGKRVSELPNADVRRGVTDFLGFYRDVRPGDRSTLSYHPRSGLTLGLNGNTIGTIGGTREYDSTERRELARIVIGVWFGNDAPFSESMRDELLTPLRLGGDMISGGSPASSTYLLGRVSSYSSSAAMTAFAALTVLALSLLWNRRRSASSSSSWVDAMPTSRRGHESSAVETTRARRTVDEDVGTGDACHRRRSDAVIARRALYNVKTSTESSWAVRNRLYPKPCYSRTSSDYYPDLVEVDSDDDRAAKQ